MFVDELVNIFVPQFQVDLQGFVIPLVICAPIIKLKIKNLLPHISPLLNHAQLMAHSQFSQRGKQGPVRGVLL